LGADSGRAIVGEISEGKLRLSEIHRFPTGGIYVNGHYYWDILGLYAQIIDGMKKYSKVYGSHVDGIGIDTWGCDFGLIDSNGNLLGNPYTYRDPQNMLTPQIIESKFGIEKLYRMTGIQMLPFNTVNQLVSLVESKDPMILNAENLLFIGDLLNYFLTGEKSSEYTVSSISQLYRAESKQWIGEIFSSLRIPEKIAPRVLNTGETVGILKTDIAAETGLDRVRVIAPAIHDTASAVVAVPTEEQDGWAFLSSGTWSIAGIETDRPIINDSGYRMNISNSGGAFGKNLYLKNIMGNWIIQSCKRVWNKANPSLSYSDIDRLVSRAKPFAAFIDPDNSAFMNPSDMTETISRYVSETGQRKMDKNDIGAICRIVYESLAFKYKYIVENLMNGTGKGIKTLHMLGGGSKNHMLNQATANALGVYVTAGPVEATAIGNLMMQAAGSGLYGSLKEIRRVVLNSFEILEYHPDASADWNDCYPGFLQATGLQKQ
jgi:rhamnulokinase